MSYFNQIQTQPADSGAIDAFGRQRVSSLVTLFDGKLIHDSGPLLWDDQETSGSGTSSTYNTNQSSQTIGVGAATAGARLRQTFRRFGYQAGKSHMVMATVNFRGAVSGVNKDVGYIDANNGICFRIDGSGGNVLRRSYVTGSAVDEIVPQASWNIDKMDGTGPSGYTVDWTKVQILFMDIEWLGVGRVRMGLVIDGVVRFVHYFRHANIIETVYMQTPNLPVSYRIENDGSGVAATLDCICSSVSAEEGRDPVGFNIGISSDDTLGNRATDSVYPLINLRLDSTRLDSIIQFVNLSAVSDSQEGRVFRMTLVVNGTITNPGTWATIPNTSVQAMLAGGTTTITGGRIAFVAAVTGRETLDSQQQDSAILGSLIDGTPNVVSLCVEPLSAAMNIIASINLRELA